ncbi:hypothetical protein HYV50_02360 [Candidatus Pacearchaeota archaeon]|nr:hypothetical protein [Candidatus Pacearchaeota archaeon]
MKTIALKERTFDLLKELKEKEKSESFDELVLELVIRRENIPDSMFGSLKGKTGGFKSEERIRLWKDENRR